jgi:sorting nexin-4
MDPDDVFDSVTWETPSAANGYEAGYIETRADEGATAGRRGYITHDEETEPHEPKWEGYLVVSVVEPIKELDGTKDMYVSYLVAAKVSTT